MLKDLNSLAFVDCYALNNALPSVDEWILLLEAYEALDPNDEQSAVVAGGAHKWEVTFTNLTLTESLKISQSFVTDFRTGYESCEIYKLKGELTPDGQINVEIHSDYITGHFVCQSVKVNRLR